MDEHNLENKLENKTDIAADASSTVVPPGTPPFEYMQKRTLWMTGGQYELGTERAKAAGLSFSEFARQQILKGKVVPSLKVHAPTLELLGNLHLENTRQGTNLNQCTTALNSDKYANLTGHERMLVDEVQEAIIRAEEKIDKQNKLLADIQRMLFQQVPKTKSTRQVASNAEEP